MSKTRSIRARRSAVEVIERRTLLANFLVTPTADDGPGSFRQAIIDSNTTTGPNTIQFGIGNGPQTIIPLSPLPAITNPVTIDATSQPGYVDAPIIQIDGSQIFTPGSNPPRQAPNVTGLIVRARSTVRGLVINRFTGSGLILQGGSGSTVAGNYIGVGLDGETSLGNGVNGVGVVDSRNNVVGGLDARDRNVVSGNGSSGIVIASALGQVLNGGNTIVGNLIGTDATGMFDVGNQFSGVTLNTAGNLIGGLVPGAGNVIAFNRVSGVGVYNFSSGPAINELIQANLIYSNGSRAIDLSFGAGDPVSGAQLTSAYLAGAGTVLEGRFRGAPDSQFSLQVFANPAQAQPFLEEGRTLVGTVTVETDDFGLAEFQVPLPAVAAGRYLSATATNLALSSTSEFFGSVLVTTTARADVGVTTTAFPDPVFAGGSLTYTITAFNSGPSLATGVVVSDLLPAGVAIDSIDAPDGKVDRSGGGVSVAYDRLPTGTPRTIRIVVIPATTGTLTNTVSIRADQTDVDPDDDEATLETTVLANPSPPLVTDQRLIVSNDAITGMILSFNQPLDPTQAVNPLNYSLATGDQPGLFNVTVPLQVPSYDAASSILTLTPTQPLQLGKVYRLTINGQGSAGVDDLAGVLLTGNTAQGAEGPYIWDFSRGVVPQPPLFVAAQKLIVTRSAIAGVALTFSRPLDPDQAVNPINYSLEQVNPNGRTSTVPLLSPVYDPMTRTVTLTPTSPLRLGRLYRLTVDGQDSAGVVDESGGLLIGNTTAGPEGPWTSSVSRGYVPRQSPRAPIPTSPRARLSGISPAVRRSLMTATSSSRGGGLASKVR